MQHPLTVDPKHYYRQVLHGYYNFNCVVSEGVTRTAKFYVPEGSVYNQPTVFLMVPASMRPANFCRTAAGRIWPTRWACTSC